MTSQNRHFPPHLELSLADAPSSAPKTTLHPTARIRNCQNRTHPMRQMGQQLHAGEEEGCGQHEEQHGHGHDHGHGCLPALAKAEALEQTRAYG